MFHVKHPGSRLIGPAPFFDEHGRAAFMLYDAAGKICCMMNDQEPHQHQSPGIRKRMAGFYIESRVAIMRALPRSHRII